MSYKGYNGAETISYPYKQFKTCKEVWSQAAWDEAYSDDGFDKSLLQRLIQSEPDVYRKPFSDYNTAADTMEPGSIGVYGTGANRAWIVAIGYSSEW